MNILFLTKIGKIVLTALSVTIFSLTYVFCYKRLPHVLPPPNPQCDDGKVRGVNLGGWLLLEPWITPNIFEDANAHLANGTDIIIDEWTFHQFLPTTYAKDVLENHWDTFILRSDLDLLFSAGISHLRIPLGYWIFDTIEGEPFPPSSGDDNTGPRYYLRRLTKWCREIGLKVVLDLHGAPGSQNGFDNSGRRGLVEWVVPGGNLSNVDRTLLVHDLMIDMIFGWIKDELIDDSTIYGMAILNEPMAGWEGYEHVWNTLLEEFHPRAYNLIRKRLGSEIKVIIQQGFRNPRDFVGLMNQTSNYTGVMLDLHNYHFWNKKLNDQAVDMPTAFRDNLRQGCDYREVIEMQTLPTIVGEWSLASTDCLKYLYGFSSHYSPKLASSGTCHLYHGRVQNYSTAHRAFLGDFMLTQMSVYESGGGYFFWTAKTNDPSATEWDFLALLKNGLVPPTLCGTKATCVFDESDSQMQATS